MRLISITGMLCMAALVASVTTQAIANDAAFIDGDQYTKMSDDQRTVYVEGLYDMLSRMTRAVDAPDEKTFLDRVARCTSGMSVTQLREFIDAYMSEDPAYKQYGMASNYRAALFAKCPQ
jgi:hypothetical protein